MTALMRESPFQATTGGCDTTVAESSRLAGLAPRPTGVAETGLSLTFLAALLAKHLATAGVLATSQLIERLALSGPILGQVLNFLRAEGRIEVRARLGRDAELRYGLTDKGSVEAAAALSRSGYVGPAPVPLADYVALVAKQSVHARNNPHIVRLAKWRHDWRAIVGEGPGHGADGIEDKLYWAYGKDIFTEGFRAAHEKWGSFLWGPINQRPGIRHTNGRGAASRLVEPFAKVARSTRRALRRVTARLPGRG